MKRFARFFQYVGDDIGDGTLTVAPAVEGIYAASDQYEALVFDKLVMNRLSRDIFALEVTFLDTFSDIAEVHRFTVIGQNDIDFVANILWINSRPFDKSPLVFQASKFFRCACKCSYGVRVFV